VRLHNAPPTLDRFSLDVNGHVNELIAQRVDAAVPQRSSARERDLEAVAILHVPIVVAMSHSRHWSRKWEQVLVAARRADATETTAPRLEGQEAVELDLETAVKTINEMPDYLASDPSLDPEIKARAQGLGDSGVLARCRDLANDLKHGGLDAARYKKRPMPEMGPLRNDVAVTVGEGVAFTYHTSVGGVEQTVVDLIRESVLTWQRFLVAEGVLQSMHPTRYVEPTRSV
jgi:hypothetical protein